MFMDRIITYRFTCWSMIPDAGLVGAALSRFFCITIT